MGEPEGDDPVATRETIAPAMHEALERILAKTREVRAWAIASTDLEESRRAAILDHLVALEQAAHTFAVAASKSDVLPAALEDA